MSQSLSQTDPGGKAESGRIGIVIIGRNEGDRLNLCLTSLGGRDRVIYADSASTDHSVSTAKAFGVETLQLTDDVPLTAARGRNAGARLLLERGDVDYIQFIDGDCELIPGWLEAARAFLADNPQVAAVCGQRIERAPTASLYNKLSDREWNTPVGEAESCGGDSMVRAAAFVAVGGFADDQVAHEEPEFCARLREQGWKVWRIDRPMTTHDAATFHVSEFYRRCRRAGLGMGQARLRHGSYIDTASRSIIRRALFWAVLVPAAALIALALDWRLSMAIAAIYPLQWLRLAVRAKRRENFSTGEAMKVAALNFVGKFAEADGAIRALLRY